jgi:hypothetical protein
MVALPSILVDAGAERPRFVPTAIADRITGLAAVNAVSARCTFANAAAKARRSKCRCSKPSPRWF